MIIRKIELENFMCYSGKNCITFSEGINVVIGDNGYGKSKLYDAFYWVMYDQVFVSEKKEFQNTRTVRSAIISDKIKADTQNGKINASVKITFHNLDRDSMYILERRYSVLSKEGIIQENNDSEFTLLEKELSYLNARMVTDDERRKSILNNILPSQIKDYLWFQGEQVESIIDFNKHDTLTKAINVLSNISRYDALKNIASIAAKAANNEYDRELKRLSKDTVKSSKLELDKKNIEEELKELLLEEEEINNNLSRAESRSEDLLNKQVDAQKVSILQERRNGYITQLEELNQSLSFEQNNFHRKMFRNKWVLKGTENLQKKYANRFSHYEKTKLKLETERDLQEKIEDEVISNLQTRLPINVPEPNYLEWMLEKQRCLVCDREAIKNSAAWLKINELLDLPSKMQKNEKQRPLTLHNFSDDFKRLYQNGLSLSNRINEIDDDINDTLLKSSEMNRKVRELNNQLLIIESDIQKLLVDTSLTKEEAENILKEYSIQNQKAKDFKEDLNIVVQKIAHKKGILKNINENLESLITGEIASWLIEKKNILNDFEQITDTTRDRVFNNLITTLEEEANSHYQNMTAGNKSSKGKIKLRKLPNGNYMPEINDSNGNPLLGLNTSNLILVKLSAIMAIISAKGNSGEIYTLITDAPTSVFGEDYTIGFCKTISKVYKQSIIMSKEFYKNHELRNELLTNPEIRIGKVYTITPSVSENERIDRNNLSTEIDLLN
ncbi:AAA family ATPase [Sphingobacterium siyangense]|uniref:AAA family ATPase n=1 Tax=Sphingobacterium siyangense TaxID=459529 RepID=UPI00200DBE29|nr:AAA family ATPase [Sphingobacterium siyangense]UQA77578.1 AAA family ATPase [Sphingobacterium siyangense]